MSHYSKNCPKGTRTNRQIAQTRFYKHKMYVFMQDDPLDRVFFIHSGKVKIYQNRFIG